MPRARSPAAGTGKNRHVPFATTNPATGEVEQAFADHTPEEVEARLARAAAAFLDHRRTTFAERARLLSTAADLLEGELPDVARILTTEMGKTFAQAKGEVAKCAMAMRWFAEHAERLLADEAIADLGQPQPGPLPAARPGAGRHAVELPPVAGGPLRRPGPHGRQRRACSSTPSNVPQSAPC